MIDADDRDREIVAARMATLNKREGPRCGDFVRFACGTLRRISHLWPHGAQTSDAGSFYLSDGHVSFSGSLYDSVCLRSLTRTDETRKGSVWIFHHNVMRAHSGVHFDRPFRVYECDREATT